MGGQERVSRFNVSEAGVDELRKHYAETLKPALVNTIAGSKAISVADQHFSIGEFGIWAGNCPPDMEICISDPPDMYAMYLPLTEALEFEIRGQRHLLAPGTIFACDLGHSNSLRFRPNRSHIGIGFSRKALTQQLSEMIDAPVMQDIELMVTADTRNGPGRKLAAMCKLLWTDLVTNANDFIATHSNEMLVRTIMVTLLESFPHRYSALLNRRQPSAVPRHVKRAIDFMMAQIASPLTIEDIAREAGVSVRGLQAAFRQFKDMTPMAYLRQLRLDGVRCELKSGRSRDVLISDIAKRWGFSHMGRFSALYVRAFGETPRQTLDR
ncbi:AraC family transcriptional regulator [Rhizobium sp. LEGMi198b]|uniref:AraC family transcriptional regulator n=1 Tax=unclassified Rhizobium TaxID=2613769 RepID=UPI0021A40FAF|nr:MULTISPECIES: AraC family transcriptional regulator [Rhizobium]UWU24268.1 AraC family transcriptional regulator [Rhizobium tropici]WFU05253.1 AraC family transcriptional regulator [Rhizobium sp. CB3171]